MGYFDSGKGGCEESTFARGDLTACLPRAWQWSVQRAQSQWSLRQGGQEHDLDLASFPGPCCPWPGREGESHSIPPKVGPFSDPRQHSAVATNNKKAGVPITWWA